MSTTIEILPITRIEGHASIHIQLDDAGDVSDARVAFKSLRGFEKFVEGKPAEELPRIVSRICGICPWMHHIAATKAVDACFGVEVPMTGHLLRELMLTIAHVEDKLLHFFFLAGPDFFIQPDQDYSVRNIMGLVKANPGLAHQVVTMRHKAKSILEAFSQKAIHPVAAVPGGFTYGDDVSSGKILANELRYKLAGDLEKFVGAGRLIIGICNGFQVLVKSGLLPGKGVSGEELEATLTTNDTARYEDRWVYLMAAKGPETGSQNRCLWTKGVEQIMYIPAAHGEGKFVPRDNEVLDKLRLNGQVVFRYVDPHGRPAGFPWNPNGSVDNIAGVCDITGRIFGLMPHPERHLFASQHPRWTRGEAHGEGDGVRIFRNGVKSV